MYLMRLVSKEEIDGYTKDDYCGSLFGEYNQVEVTHTYKVGYDRFYIVKCDICSKDTELFGDGYFKTTKCELNMGGLPCGCTKAIKWNEDQWIVRATRQANSQGFRFDGWAEPFKGGRTKCKLTCNEHGCEWASATVSSLVVGTTNCPVNRYYNRAPYSTDFIGRTAIPEDDVIPRVIVKCNELGIKFKGWVGIYSGAKTYCVLECEKHGEWSTTDLSHLLSSTSKRCPGCSSEAISKARKMEDHEHIIGFMATGSFVYGSEFKKVSGIGEIPTWEVYCPICDVTRTSRQSNLKEGKKPCDCSHRQSYKCYIHSILDNGTAIGIKFGITVNQIRRLASQRCKSVFDIEPVGIWEMIDPETARKCEAHCLKTFECGVFSKQEVGDGFTETTWTYNLDKIIEIYEDYGGIRIE